MFAEMWLSRKNLRSVALRGPGNPPMTEWEMEASKRASEDSPRTRERERAGEEGEREVRPNEREPRAGDVACVAASSFQRQREREREKRLEHERNALSQWNGIKHGR